MKKLLSTCALFLLAFCAIAQSSRLTGSTNSGTRGAVYLYEIVDGAPKLLKSSMSSTEGTFSFEFEPSYEGFYLLGGFTKAAGQNPIYIKKNDNLQVDIVNRELKFVGTVNPENASIMQWQSLRKEMLENTASTYISSKASKTNAIFNSNIKKADAFLGGIKTENKMFNQSMNSFVKFDLDYHIFQFLKKDQHVSGLSSYKCYAGVNMLKDDAVLAYPRGRELLVLYADQKNTSGSLQFGLDNLKSPRQKAFYLWEKEIPSVKTYAAYEAFMQDYSSYMDVDGLRDDNERLGAKLLNERVGATGSAFSLPDPNGKNYGLKDFKGKVVLINVWATYCGPCKAQMPSLEALKTKMKDQQDVVFVGVAFDGPRALESWKKMIVEKNMTGLQLFGGGGGNLLAKDYGIKVMPRYLLFDREGRLVTANAPAPGTPSLEKMLLETLKNK